MIRVLKQGATEAEKTEADRKVRQTVEAILEDIAAAATRRFASCRRSSTNGSPPRSGCGRTRSSR